MKSAYWCSHCLRLNSCSVDSDSDHCRGLFMCCSSCGKILADRTTVVHKQRKLRLRKRIERTKNRSHTRPQTRTRTTTTVDDFSDVGYEAEAEADPMQEDCSLMFDRA